MITIAYALLLLFPATQLIYLSVFAFSVPPKSATITKAMNRGFAVITDNMRSGPGGR